MMDEHRIKVGPPPESETVKDFRGRKKGLEDSSAKMRRNIFIGIISVVLIAGGYLAFRKNKEISASEVLNAKPEETDGLENHQHFTAELIRSISTPIEKNNSNQDRTETDMQNNMLVLKEASQTRSNNRPDIAVPPSSVLEAHLERKVEASSVQTPVTASVDEDLEYGGKVIVPAGAKLLGYTVGIQNNNRVLIQFNSIMLPGNETLYNFSGVAVDEDENNGVEGEASRGSVYKAGTSFASTVLGMGMDSALTDNQSVFGNVMRETIQNNTQELSSLMSQTANSSEQSMVVVLAKDTPIKVLVTANY